MDPWGLLASQLCLISNLQKETLLKNKLDSMEKQHPRWFSGLIFTHRLEHSHKYICIHKHVYANTHTHTKEIAKWELRIYLQCSFSLPALYIKAQNN